MPWKMAALKDKRSGSSGRQERAAGAGRRQQEATFSAGALLALLGILETTANSRHDALGATAPLWPILLGLCKSFPQGLDQAWQCAGWADPQPLGSLGNFFDKIRKTMVLLNF